jgi:lysophospholipase L1-like esterase
MLGADIVNLGFSGNGQCEPEMAELISEIDGECFVIDPVANMTTTGMKERYGHFVETIRRRWPRTPIALMTRICFAYDAYRDAADCDQARDAMNAVVLETYEKMRTQGDSAVYYFDSAKVIPVSDNHPTVDGVHLTDEGFRLLTEALVPVLAKILK